MLRVVLGCIFVDGGGRSPRKVKKKRVATKDAGAVKAAAAKSFATVVEQGQSEVAIHPIDVMKESSEDSASLPSFSIESSGQFADEERWFRELVAPDTQTLEGAREEIELTDSHQAGGFREGFDRDVREETTEKVESAVKPMCEVKPASETAVVNEELEVTEMETEKRNRVPIVTEMWDVKGRDDGERDEEKEDVPPVENEGSDEQTVSLRPASAMSAHQHQAETNSNSELQVEVLPLDVRDLEADGSCVFPETQAKSEAQADISPKTTEKNVDETEEVDNVDDLLDMTRDTTPSSGSLLDSTTCNQTVDSKTLISLSADEAANESVVEEREGKEKVGDAVEVGEVVDTSGEMSLQLHEERTCEREDVDSQLQTEFAGTQSDENGGEIGAAFDAVVSRSDASVEYCGQLAVGAKFIPQVTVCQTDVETEEAPEDGDTASEGSEHEGEEPAASFLQSMGQNDLSRYLTWNNDTSDQSAVDTLTLRLPEIEKTETSESEETVTDVIVSPYGDKQPMLSEHLATKQTESRVERGNGQLENESEADSLLDSYDILPDVPEGGAEGGVTVETQSEAIGAEFEATMKELQLSDTFDFRKLVNFDDDHFSQPEVRTSLCSVSNSLKVCL